MGWSGMNGLEWNGLEWNGLEWSEPEWTGCSWRSDAASSSHTIPTAIGTFPPGILQPWYSLNRPLYFNRVNDSTVSMKSDGIYRATAEPARPPSLRDREACATAEPVRPPSYFSTAI
jgi:hypothetical protein